MKYSKHQLLLSSLVMTGSAIAQQAEQVKPNMLLFIADDCSYYDLGVYGSKESKTPNIDRFASEGIRFTKGYQVAPMSSPTRHNLYTGMWPVKTGAYPNHTFAKDGTKSIVHYLKAEGYRVAMIGKTHILPASVFPFEYVPLINKGQDLNMTAIDTFISSCTKSKTPYCLFVTSHQPHDPWDKGDTLLFDQSKITLPPFYVDTKTIRSEFCKYLAEINYMDNEFGSVLKIIDKHKQRENTAVVFLSEQGNSLPFAKWTCYDAGVHSAYIVRWPGKVKPGRISDAIVEYCDIVPTFIEMANAKPVPELDGVSIVPILLEKQKEVKQYTYSIQTSRGIVMGGEYFGIRSVADKKFRYILNLTPEMTFQNTTTRDLFFKEWLEMAKTDSVAKAITYKYQHRPAVELYDVENDPYCLINLAGKPENKKIIDTLDSKLKSWMLSCGDKGQETEMEAKLHQGKGK